MNGSTVLCRFTLPTLSIRNSAVRNIFIRGTLPAFAGVLLLTGCGGGSGGSGSAAAASGSATASTSAFTTCLQEHGVKVAAGQFGGARPTGSFSPGASFSPGTLPSGSPRPGASFGGANSAALKACAKYAPSGFAGGNQAISSSALAAFKSCLKSNGVQVTGSTANQILAELRNSTGKTATALHTCQVLIQPAAPTPTASS